MHFLQEIGDAESIGILIIAFLLLAIMSSISHDFIHISRWNKYYIRFCKKWFRELFFRWLNLVILGLVSFVPGILYLSKWDIPKLTSSNYSTLSLLLAGILTLLMIHLLICYLFEIEINQVTRFTIISKKDAKGFVWQTQIPEAYGPEIYFRYAELIIGGLCLSYLVSWKLLPLILPLALFYGHYIIKLYIEDQLQGTFLHKFASYLSRKVSKKNDSRAS